ncbi:5-fold beta-flower protein [Commensalibacter oyaizuii]|uniref:Uncharacterized protein n=1 Tax=Commensalibacter oyaizuii TaxID=3043873 RepID=A0ABT6Q3D0_9PROT|nr:hypothetical protein [Commensalibacter sp. TBRC 16381]MDI2091503.1 hypothetical protein [Commensalibacter sp. TBRC 16381]
MKLNTIFLCLSIGILSLKGGISSAALAADTSYNNVAPVNNPGHVSIRIQKIDQAGYIYNVDNLCIGKISKDGNIYNGNNISVGRIYSNGYLYNSKNDNIGRVNKKGNIFNMNNVNIGMVDKKGKVYTTNNEYVGEVASKYRNAATLLLLSQENNPFSM